MVDPEFPLCKVCKRSNKMGYKSRGFCSLECRFWDKVEKKLDHECWLWKSFTNHSPSRNIKYAYGKFRVDGIGVYAHRLAWELTKGPIPGDLEVCHVCDNRLCCNPNHMFIASHKENMSDAAAKGQMCGPKKDRKIPRCEYEKIKNLRKLGKNGEEIAKIYGVSRSRINKILRDFFSITKENTKVPEQDYQKIKDLKKMGYSNADIARIYRCSRANIRQIVEGARDV